MLPSQGHVSVAIRSTWHIDSLDRQVLSFHRLQVRIMTARYLPVRLHAGMGRRCRREDEIRSGQFETGKLRVWSDAFDPPLFFSFSLSGLGRFDVHEMSVRKSGTHTWGTRREVDLSADQDKPNVIGSTESRRDKSDILVFRDVDVHRKKVGFSC